MITTILQITIKYINTKSFAKKRCSKVSYRQLYHDKCLLLIWGKQLRLGSMEQLPHCTTWYHGLWPFPWHQEDTGNRNAIEFNRRRQSERRKEATSVWHKINIWMVLLKVNRTFKRWIAGKVQPVSSLNYTQTQTRHGKLL